MSDSIQSIFNFLQLSENIATGGQPREEQIQAIAMAGFELVVNLALVTSDNAIVDEGALVRSSGMEYVHIPVIWERPTAADLASFLHVMDQNNGKKIFVHCVANMRVSVFMALYRALRQNLPLDAAMTDVRKIWEPDEVWHHFIRQNIGR
jgi:protein tyrosine phosphatase (PTP) superfamily phosphohydrolase (DUF442 family)